MIEKESKRSAVDKLLDLPPYGVRPAEKDAALMAAVNEELAHHVDHCEPYRRWSHKHGLDRQKTFDRLADVPFLPVGIFKRLELASVPQEKVVRTLTSSATSSQIPSRIVLDQVTRARQIRALTSILMHRIGGQRRPFVVLDAPPNATADPSRELSARAAGLRGYLMAATETHYVLEGSELRLDIDKLRGLIDGFRSKNTPFCLLGYTYLLYRHVVAALLAKKGSELFLRNGPEGASPQIDLTPFSPLQLPDDAMVLHFGGWKKLQNQSVTKDVLTAHTAEAFGIDPSAICDIYGFTEQLGVIYPDGRDGVKRTPTYSEVLVRDPRTFEVLPDGETGLLEFVCPLPHSYPGVAILLDDLGRIVTREPGPDGITGTGFEVVGRASRAEPRGCGDTLQPHVYETERPR